MYYRKKGRMDVAACVKEPNRCDGSGFYRENELDASTRTWAKKKVARKSMLKNSTLPVVNGRGVGRISSPKNLYTARDRSCPPYQGLAGLHLALRATSCASVRGPWVIDLGLHSEGNRIRWRLGSHEEARKRRVARGDFERTKA